MTTRYSRLSGALRQLQALHLSVEEKAVVKVLRDYWQSVPALDAIGKGSAPDSQSQIVEEADAVLRPKPQ